VQSRPMGSASPETRRSVAAVRKQWARRSLLLVFRVNSRQLDDLGGIAAHDLSHHLRIGRTWGQRRQLTEIADIEVGRHRAQHDDLGVTVVGEGIGSAWRRSDQHAGTYLHLLVATRKGGHT
jgi:hypothetical protein